jgi:NCAIR mutase (PurE)-related protein
LSIERVLEEVKNGTLDIPAALEALQREYFEDLGHTVLDHNRRLRTGSEEVIFGSGKTAAQIQDIVAAMLAQGANILVTRLEESKFTALRLPANAAYHPDSQILTIQQAPPSQPTTSIAVVTAGTSDHAVAEEAALTAEFFGNKVLRIFDVGVAGLHRLLARLDDLRTARVLVVVAGMEGALPSVVGGLVDKPVIAVPTSVGYGAAFDGVAALLGMLTSCASGVAVVNIDNGFGAGYLANNINRL